MAISAEAVYLLNNRMGSIARKVGLGTLISDAEAVAPSVVALTDAHILVGSVANLAADVAMSGDMTIARTGAVTIAALAITAGKIAADAVTTAKILDANVTTAKIADDNVTTAKILAANVTTAKIADSNVTTAKIAAAGVTIAKLDPAVMLEATGTLTQANIVGMQGTAVDLIAAPGAGKIIIVDEIELFHDYAVAAYAGGGDVSFQYGTSLKPISVLDVLAVTVASDKNYLIKPSASYTSSATAATETDLSTSVNVPVQVTNATTAFTGGDATNIFKWRIRYHVVTVLT